MAHSTIDIEGIGEANAAKLAKANIKTLESLLDRCANEHGRKEVAQVTGVTPRQLLTWANMADLMRIRGIGAEFAELLEASGVDTVRELAMRNATQLAETVHRVNATKHLTRRTPNEQMIQGWIDQAKALKPMITH